jgi:hypothetical protein
MDGCGHRCCEIPSNSYHTHLGTPSTCARCAHEPGTGPVSAFASPPPAGPPAVSDDGEGPSPESYLLGRIVADVLARLAPEIPGLPAGDELSELVASHALALYAAGIVEPDLQSLSERERHTVLTSRVGLALAFPPPIDPSATPP